MSTEPIIRSVRRYTGADHPWLRGERAVVVAVRRGDALLLNDEAIATLCPTDRVDFAPLLDEDGVTRASWLCSDAGTHELGVVEGAWLGTLPGDAGPRILTD